MKKLVLSIFLASVAYSQPVVTGPRIDLTHALATAPIKEVTTLPTGISPQFACRPGDMVILTTAPLGQQIYLNSATGNCVWTLQSGGGGGGGLADPGANGVIKRTALNVTAPALSTDVISLFSGCSGVEYLGADGACHAPMATGNPYIVSSSTSPQLILAATHLQGINPIVLCFNGPISGGATTGHQVVCDSVKNNLGDVQIAWGGTTVGSIEVLSSGTGQQGPPGPPGPGGTPGGSNGQIQFNNSGVFGGYTLVPVTNGGSGAGTLTGLLKGNGTSAFSAAAASDVAAIFTGCSGIQYLGADGNCHNPAAGTGTVTHTLGPLISTALMTGNGAADSQTPCSTCTLSSGGNMSLPGSGSFGVGGSIAGAIDLGQGTDPGTGGTNTFSLVGGPSITSYRWQVPSADSAGFIKTNGAGTPGLLSVNPAIGSGSVLLGSSVTGATCGDATHVSQITFNNVGQTTACTPVAITGGGGGGGGGAQPYAVNTTSSPQTILASVHLQGINPAVQCWSGALSSGATTGTFTNCAITKNASGDVTVAWSGTVGSIEVMAAGSGGPAIPYATNTTSSPQTVLESTHLQGINPAVQCWSGALSAGATTGNLTNCAVSKNAAGDVTVSWSGTLGSFEILAAGPGPAGGGGGGGTGTVTHTVGPLSTNAIMTGNGGADSKTPNTSAQLDSSGNAIFPGYIQSGHGLLLPQGTIPSLPANTFALYPNTSIGTSYGWQPPSSDCAGVLNSDGATTPSHITCIATSGSGNILRASAVAPATSGTSPLKGNGSGGFSNAIATDIISLFTGCSGIQYLGADGNCHNSGGGSTSPGGSSGQIQFNSSGSFGGFTASGDATVNTGTGAVTVTKTGGVSFAPSATTDTTNAGNISSGVLGVLRGGSGVGTISGLIKGNGTSPFSAGAAADVTALFSGCSGTQYLGADGNCHSVSGSNPLIPAVAGSGTVSVSGTSVSGSGSNFLTLFPLCTPSCTHGEAIAVYPTAVSQAGKHITTTPLPQDFAGSSNNREPSSLIWEPDGNSIAAISLADVIVPTRNYNTQAGNASIPPEFWSIAGSIGLGSNHLQGVIPVYPNVGSRYPYPFLYCTNSSVCDFYLTTPPNTTNGSVIVVGNSPWNGSYVVTDNTSGFNYSAEATIIRTTNPNGLSAGFHIVDGMTSTISGVPIGASPTVSIVVSGGTATATFLYAHGLTVGDVIHISGFTGGSSGINVSSATILTVGDNDFPTVATFSTGAGNGTYAQQTGVISLSYTSTPHAVWSAVSSVASNTTLTLTVSSGTVVGGATYASAPDNVPSFNTFISSATDAFITTTGDYYFSNDPSNTGNGIAVNNWNNYLGVTSGVHFILTQPGHEGFKFSGGNGFVLDNWTVNTLFQSQQTSPVPFLQAVSVFNANRPIIRNFTTTMNMGNLIDIENTTQPRVTGLRAFNVSDGGCLVVAAVTQPLIADGQCYNSNDFTSLFMQNNFADQAMGKAVLGNWIQVNAGALALTGPNILIDNAYLEASGITIFQAASTTGGIKISNSRLTNGWANRPTQILGEIDINTGFDVVIDNVDIVSATSTGIKANGNVSVTVNNSKITGSRFEGIFSGGSTTISVGNTNVESTGGAGVILFNSGNLSISGLTVKNSNGTYGYPSHGTDAVLTANNTLSDFRNIRIIDTRGTALGYTAFLNDTGRTSDVIGLISDASRPFFTLGGTAGQTYVKDSGYIFPTISIAGSNQTISPISATSFISGSTASIQTIIVPKAMVRQDQFCLIPTLGSTSLSTTTGGNIGLASTLAAGQVSCFKWDGSLFWPPASGTSSGTFSGNVEAGGLVRAQGNITPVSGAGVETVYSTGIGGIYAYDRTGATFKPMTVDGTTLSLNVQTNGPTTTGGTLQVGSGSANIVYRCVTAGVLPVGTLTTNSLLCATSADTGLRVQ